jgi:PadR family transcriptional regulator, regulatory protein PadR
MVIIKNERNRQFPTKISTTSLMKLFILTLLEEGSHYGNQIIDEIKLRLQGKWEPSPGMIYPLLRDLESEGFIKGWWEEPDKKSIRHYRITTEGSEHLKKLKLIYKPVLEDSLIIIKNSIESIFKKGL